MGIDTEFNLDRESDMNAVLGDWRRAYELLEHGTLDLFRGRFVAVLNGELIGNGEDEGQLRSQCAKDKNIDPERVVVMYVDDGEYLLSE